MKEEMENGIHLFYCKISESKIAITAPDLAMTALVMSIMATERKN
jgi:hypothetical protein